MTPNSQMSVCEFLVLNCPVKRTEKYAVDIFTSVLCRQKPLAQQTNSSYLKKNSHRNPPSNFAHYFFITALSLSNGYSIIYNRHEIYNKTRQSPTYYT